MKNIWLTQSVIDGINAELKKSGATDFVGAYTVLVAYIEANFPSFRSNPDYMRLDLCHSNGRGFFVDLTE